MNFLFFVGFLSITSALYLLEVDEPVPDRYIVVFQDNITKSVRNEHIGGVVNASILYEYDFPGFYGYAAEMGETGLKSALSSPLVKYVEQDGVVRASDCYTQEGATWGLQRTAEENLVLTGEYKYEENFQGQNVRAYVIDTGIYLTHNDFGGRAVWGTNTIDNSDSDGNGHGTHVAGTIGSSTYGLAKQATLVAVKVLNSGGSGTTASVIAGINWVVDDVAKYGKKKRQAKGVGNMSLGGGRSTSMNDATDKAVEAEVLMAVAAGNDYGDACNYSPASAELATSVGASDNTDSMAYFSNFGLCVDLFGPGLGITSTWNGGPNSDNTLSGTSMAAPHVAGIAVKLMSQYPDYDAEKLKDEILGIATEGKLSGVRTSPNLLTYHGCLNA